MHRQAHTASTSHGEATRRTSVATLALLQIVSWGTLYYVFPVLLLPMQVDLGWSQTKVLAGTSLALAIQGALASRVGRLIDQGHARVVILGGCAAGVTALVALSFVQQYWHYLVVVALIGIASGCTQYEAAFATLKTQSGAAFSKHVVMVTLAGGLASTAFVPFGSWIIAMSDWRQMLQIYAAILVPVAATAYLFLKKSQPREEGPTAPADLARPAQSTRRIAILLAASFCSFGFMYTVLLLHLLPLLQQGGLSSSVAVIAYTLIGPSQLVGRFTLLYGGDRMPFAVPAAIATVSPLIALVLLVTQPGGVAMAMCFAVMFGAGMGIKTIVQATAAPRLLGTVNYGQLQGLLLFPAFIAQAGAPFASGLLLEIGGYPVLLGVCLAISALSVITMLLAVHLARRR